MEGAPPPTKRPFPLTPPLSHNTQDPFILEKLAATEASFESLHARMADPAVAGDADECQRVARAAAELEPAVTALRAYRAAEAAAADAREILKECDGPGGDPEMAALAREEGEDAASAMGAAAAEMTALMLPRDPLDDKPVMLEIRAGTGGEEAALWAADLLRMYKRYAETQGWTLVPMNTNLAEAGGLKEAVVRVEAPARVASRAKPGAGVYAKLKYEAGVHRVQRVPQTEAQGRIHTSAVTVAILPEAEEVDVQIDANDLQIDVYRSSGPGGQSVNTTDSAVRVTHVPTGLVVTCQDEKSQLKNKVKAISILRARLLARKMEEEASQRSAERKSQVGSGDRSERVRTYNFPQNRLTDHRVNLTLYQLDGIMEGELQPVVDALVAADRAARLAQV